MTTDRAFADRLIAGNGWLPEANRNAPNNPQCVKIIEYENAWGGTAYGCVFATDRAPDRYDLPTEYIRAPRVLWSVDALGVDQK
jgi:hypothetical protein